MRYKDWYHDKFPGVNNPQLNRNPGWLCKLEHSTSTFNYDTNVNTHNVINAQINIYIYIDIFSMS